MKSNSEKRFEDLLYKISYGRGVIQAFSDMLDSILFHMIIYDELDIKRNPVAKYDDKDKALMKEIVDCLGQIINEYGGYHDAVGDLFMAYISQGKNDQYFTPHNVANMISGISEGADGRTVIDSACGSGRLLLGAAKKNADRLFYGSDIDLTCAKMAVLNLSVNNMVGEIVWGNPMTYQHFASFQINKDVLTNYPVIFVRNQENTIHFKRSAEESRQVKEEQLNLF